MPNLVKSQTVVLALLICFSVPLADAQQQALGSIIGHVRVMRSGSPPEHILIGLEFRGATIDTVYTDSEGTYGFHSLLPNPYHIVVQDDQYQPQRLDATINPTSLSPTIFVDITLVPKDLAKTDEKVPPKASGANANLTDVREYAAKFPKAAVKEFEKGTKADQADKKDDAIRHYQKAVQIAPEFYEAHNNLGSDYLSKSDFASARKEFEQAIQQNQSDAAGYFNLSNTWMLLGNLPEAQKYLDEGLRREPESALGEFLMGSLKMKTGHLPEAEQALQKAIELGPTMVQPRLQLVNLLLQQGKNDAAAAQLTDFVTKFPDNPFSPQARKVLERLQAPSQASAPVPH